MGAPWVDPKSTLAPDTLYVVLVQDLENESEALFQFIFPLKEHGRRCGNDDFTSFLAKQEFTCDQSGLDGFSEAHVVGDKEVHAREQKCLLQRLELISVQSDAGS